MSTLPSILIACFLLSGVSLVGSILLLWKKLDLKDVTSHFIGFAAGVMLVTAFLDLFPEAIEHGEAEAVFLPALLGVILFFFLERFLLWFHHHDAPHGMRPSSLLILFGDGLHNIFDGVAIAAAFLTGPMVGVVTTVAIAAHEIPQELADFSILLHNGMKSKKALFLNLLTAMMAFVGALGGYFFLDTLESFIPYLLSFTAGMFVYIACSDLIPDMHQEFTKQRKWIQSVSFLTGIVLSYLLISIFPHAA